MPEEIVTITMNMKDVHDVAKKLDLEDEFKDGLAAGGVYVQGVMEDYPPESEANRRKPHPGRWYERGYGTRWYDAEGGLQGRKTSKQLGAAWTTDTRDDGLTVLIGNAVSYARPVHDKDFPQASFHARRGWPTAQDVVEDESDHVTEIISDFIQAGLEGRTA